MLGAANLDGQDQARSKLLGIGDMLSPIWLWPRCVKMEF
jgi:hypothetical protein